jgi:hypothetical protein
MAGSIIVLTNNGPDGSGTQAVFTVEYDDQLQATRFAGSNPTPVAQQCKIVGYDPATGLPDPANRTYAACCCCRTRRTS